MRNDVTNEKPQRKRSKALIFCFYSVIVLACLTLGASIGILSGNYFTKSIIKSDTLASAESASQASANESTNSQTSSETFSESSSESSSEPTAASAPSSGIDMFSKNLVLSSLTGFSSEVLVDSKVVADFKRNYTLSLPSSSNYSQLE
ncbi:MAG: hypothetical protein HGA22_08110, partial [Clostridiales bacterium]|nr:hypothetical protein [Clostridiales bacterium]